MAQAIADVNMNFMFIGALKKVEDISRV